MITVLGKFRDISQYYNRIGYNVMPRSESWTPELNRAWIDAAIACGDQFLIASNDYTGEFRNELIYLLQRISAQSEPS